MESKDVKTLTKLQAFIDQAMGISLGSLAASQREVKPHLVESDLPALIAAASLSGKEMTTRFIRMAVSNTPEYRDIASLLRRTEAYSMVSFLLQEGQGEKVETLSARYGVSSGHFRRIFRASLGSSPKSSLNDWRLAKAVLAFIERQQSITDVAMAHGYASPSHFSNEVKKTLGLSLTHLFDT